MILTLPWPIPDLGISIIGNECYSSLIEHLNISDVKCIKYSISKGLGIGIVLGGSMMKVPQLLLSAPLRPGPVASSLCTRNNGICYNPRYAFRNAFPFSTYGENFFLTIQNTIITLLIIFYSPHPSRAKRSEKLWVAAATFVVGYFLLYVFPTPILALLQLATLPLSLFSKLPQITQNRRSQSTGQLSAFAVGSQVAGCLARLFTTATEMGDALVAAGFALALVLNVVLGVQIWMYWGREEALEEGLNIGYSMKKIDEGGYEPASWEAHTQSSVFRLGTPPLQPQYTRKAD
ncbi:hypothetical protein BD779DRAFT_1536691 [Infundibulicybe gibba]|nr:hypothetical protein BD779DRAFT_1536691 [Infundibulicybe gibba]